jgi:hypothetical protein
MIFAILVRAGGAVKKSGDRVGTNRDKNKKAFSSKLS